MTVEADVQPVAVARRVAREVFGLFHAPVYTMVVTRENGHEVFRLYERLHEGNVGSTVLAVVPSMIANIPLVSYTLLVHARVGLVGTPVMLKRICGVYRNVHESHAGNRAAILLAKGVIGIAKPFDNLQESVRYEKLSQESHTFSSTQFGTPTSSPVG